MLPTQLQNIQLIRGSHTVMQYCIWYATWRRREISASSSIRIHPGFDCYCDADFSGNWNQDLAHNDPSSTAKSCSSWIVYYNGCPIIWASSCSRKLHCPPLKPNTLPCQWLSVMSFLLWIWSRRWRTTAFQFCVLNRMYNARCSRTIQERWSWSWLGFQNLGLEPSILTLSITIFVKQWGSEEWRHQDLPSRYRRSDCRRAHQGTSAKPICTPSDEYVWKITPQAPLRGSAWTDQLWYDPYMYVLCTFKQWHFALFFLLSSHPRNHLVLPSSYMHVLVTSLNGNIQQVLQQLS